MADIIACDISDTTTIEDKLKYIISKYNYIDKNDINITDVVLINTLFECLTNPHLYFDKNSYICFTLGKHFSNKKQYDKMKQYYLKAIHCHGNTNAMNNLALYYEKVEKNYKEAKNLYLSAVEKGHALAMVNLASYYKNVEINYAKVIQYNLMAIELKNPIAMNNLGIYYKNHENNNDKMLYYCLMAVRYGNFYSLYYILRYCYDENMPELIIYTFNDTAFDFNNVIIFLNILNMLNINEYLWVITLLCPINLFKILWLNCVNIYCDEYTKPQTLNTLIYLNEFKKYLNTFFELVVVKPTSSEVFIPFAKNKLNNLKILKHTNVLLECLKSCKDIKDVSYVNELELTPEISPATTTATATATAPATAPATATATAPEISPATTTATATATAPATAPATATATAPAPATAPATASKKSTKEKILNDTCNICFGVHNMYYIPSNNPICRHCYCLNCVIKITLKKPFGKCPECLYKIIQPNSAYDIGKNEYMKLP